jgi:predicted ATP-dependent endonuclease of OLD family
VNWFWTDEIQGTGFSPILLGMGASALAFASTRRAVIGEGATEAMLLPTIIREAVAATRLDYQVAPGLANVDHAAIQELDLVASRVAYLLDSDAAGDEKVKLLLGSGVPANRILRLGSARSRLVLEDLLDANVYLAAVNQELRRWHIDIRVPASAVPAVGRPAAISAWCAKQTPPINAPGKRAVAQRVLESARTQSIVASNRRAAVRKLHATIERLLGEPSHAAGASSLGPSGAR